MTEIDKLYNSVSQKITDNTIMVSYVIDLLNIPSYMVSPFMEGWFWSGKTKELINYTFDALIANYLLNTILIYKKIDIEDDVTFETALNAYTKYFNSDVSKIRKIYHTYYDCDLAYSDFSKLLLRLEDLLLDLNIKLVINSYASPYDARHSKMIKNDKFDVANLDENFR